MSSLHDVEAEGIAPREGFGPVTLCLREMALTAAYAPVLPENLNAAFRRTFHLISHTPKHHVGDQLMGLTRACLPLLSFLKK